ncbi:hypothetical protein Agub_g12402 [Astrephomene gubernaculifera]|uniref:Uncharacterized protein n=1 Tax=Astrephomene gubernaculifera TaxID=47775 RepID=A0AAD3DYK0_9CHLO|nr:hypothetical protein Agub_g12396 [Astrephomene gubernaculifera]GFR50223.1 hypothetical protein Agub_g12402 [Astrephomene gubernaculifera]
MATLISRATLLCRKGGTPSVAVLGPRHPRVPTSTTALPCSPVMAQRRGHAVAAMAAGGSAYGPSKETFVEKALSSLGIIRFVCAMALFVRLAVKHKVHLHPFAGSAAELAGGVMFILLAIWDFVARSSNVAGYPAGPPLKMETDIPVLPELMKTIRKKETEIAMMKTEITMMKTEITMMKTEITMMKTEIAMMKTDLHEVRSGICSLMTQQLLATAALVQTTVAWQQTMNNKLEHS